MIFSLCILGNIFWLSSCSYSDTADELAVGKIEIAETSQKPLLYPPQRTGLPEKQSPPSIPLPGYSVPFCDPAFKTRLIRITDTMMDTMGTQSERTQKILRHHYSKNQPWNCDGSLIQMGKCYLLDGRTYKVVGTYSRPSAECLWSYKDPRKIWTFDSREKNLETIQILEDKDTGILTSVRNVVKGFPEYDEMLMGMWEGNFSWDDRYVVLMGRKGSDLHIVVYDIAENRIESQKVFEGKWPESKEPRKNLCRMDWCSMSPSGKYVVALWKDKSNARYCGVEVYDRKLEFQRQLMDSGGHGDLGYDANGNEVWVQVTCGDKRLYDAGIVAFRLHDGSLIRVLDKTTAFSGHVSCRNYRRPGWAYVTTPGRGVPTAFAVKLDGSQTVECFANTHANKGSYQAEMHGVPNPEGTKFMFASNWDGDKDASIYSYVAEYTGEYGMPEFDETSVKLLKN